MPRLVLLITSPSRQVDWCSVPAGILCTNSFQLKESLLPQLATSGIFLAASRLNHSCRSNCDYRAWLEPSDSTWWLQVVTMSEVPAGTELTLCYNNFLETEGPVSRTERRQFLAWGYRFLCHCEDCSLEGEERRENDRARARLVELRQAWCLTSNLARERRIIGEQVSLLTRLRFCGRLEYIIQAAQCGLETETDPERISWLTNLGLQYSSWLYGASSPQARQWQRPD